MWDETPIALFQKKKTFFGKNSQMTVLRQLFEKSKFSTSDLQKRTSFVN